MDSIRLNQTNRLMLDHISASFAVDETIDIFKSRDVTVQWSVIESSAAEGHPKGQHNYGLVSGPEGIAVSVHHNLFAHHKNRCPAIANGPAEVLNNVMYDVRHGFVHHNPASGPFNIAGNYFRRGPSDILYPFYFDDENGFKDAELRYWVHGNYIDDPDGSGCKGAVENPWRECQQELLAPESLRSARRFDFSTSGACYVPVTVEPAHSAYQRVLAHAGAFPRDEVTRRTLRDVETRGGKWGAYDVDLMTGLTPSEPPADRDGDGMPDDWERAHGLDPSDGNDHRKRTPSGYTAIEVYLNELAEQLVQN
jgi:hypothetical protein